MSLKRLFLAIVAAGVALVILSFLNTNRDITIAFSKEGCEVLDVMKVPYTAGGEETAPCRLEHANISLSSLLDGYMYHVEYGGFEFDIAKGLVVWTEKNEVKRYR